jgi:hypothetical protein
MACISNNWWEIAATEQILDVVVYWMGRKAMLVTLKSAAARTIG